jgi:hypothetical protein
MIKVHDKAVNWVDGTPIYLGYKYKNCVYGEWIGYIDDSRYLPLRKEEMARELALGSGLKALPEPPSQFSNPGTFWVEWMWGALALVGLVGGMKSGATAEA